MKEMYPWKRASTNEAPYATCQEVCPKSVDVSCMQEALLNTASRPVNSARWKSVTEDSNDASLKSTTSPTKRALLKVVIRPENFVPAKRTNFPRKMQSLKSTSFIWVQLKSMSAPHQLSTFVSKS